MCFCCLVRQGGGFPPCCRGGEASSCCSGRRECPLSLHFVKLCYCATSLLLLANQPHLTQARMHPCRLSHPFGLVDQGASRHVFVLSCDLALIIGRPPLSPPSSHLLHHPHSYQNNTHLIPHRNTHTTKQWAGVSRSCTRVRWCHAEGDIARLGGSIPAWK